MEVLHRGQWGTVCDDFWHLADAAVVCREMDCGEPVDALYNAHFGQGSGPIWMNFVYCSGSESTLKTVVHQDGANTTVLTILMPESSVRVNNLMCCPWIYGETNIFIFFLKLCNILFALPWHGIYLSSIVCLLYTVVHVFNTPR